MGQPQPAVPSAPSPMHGAMTVAPPNPIAAMKAYNALDGWVRAWAAPEGLVGNDGLNAAGGCMVTLRLDRRVVGRGMSFGPGPGCFARAAQEAITQATPHLPVGHDALAEQQLHDAAAKVTISLELAGPLIPFRPATFSEVDAELQPGLDGIAARIGETVAGSFPSSMLTMNVGPADALATAISEASGDPTLALRGTLKGETAAIAAEHTATFYHFRTIQLAQTGPGGPPTFLSRGGRLVSQRDLESDGGLQAFADSLAKNLKARAEHAGKGHLAGTLLPAQGRYETQTADTLDQALAAAALGEYGALRRAGRGIKQAQLSGEEAIGIATGLLDAIKLDAGADPVPAAAWLLAAQRCGEAGKSGAVDVQARAHLAGVVAASFDNETGWASSVPEGGRSLVALALAIEAAETGVEPADSFARSVRAEAALRSIYKDTPRERLVSQMPWLGEAELALLQPGKEVPASAALRDMRDQVWKNQLTIDDAGEEGPDLVGGLVFTAARNPLPTWHSVRPVIFLAAMAREPRLTDDKEFLPELSHLMASMRFLRQLMVDDAAAYSAVDREGALGGVRSSLWDQRQPVQATALTLMAVCEMIETLRSPAQKPAQK